LNAPFTDDQGQSLGVGHGIVDPIVVKGDDSNVVTLGADTTAPRRCHAVSATFDALAVALSGGATDANGAYIPVLASDRLSKDDYVAWWGNESAADTSDSSSSSSSGDSSSGDSSSSDDNDGDTAGVHVLLQGNIGISAVVPTVRRGDVIQVEWEQGDKSHAVYCWDARTDGTNLWVQLLSSQASTAGVGVIVPFETLALRGTLETVRRKGTTITTPVLRTDRTARWLDTADARAFYRKYGHWFRVPFADGDSGAQIKQISVGRFHRLFPRYPLVIGGSNHVSDIQSPLPPVQPPDGCQPTSPVRTRDSSSALYYANNEGSPGSVRPGGFFPIAATRTWHGGIHLYPEENDAVYAPFDGVVVAARLSTPDDTTDFGDPGMVLIKTNLKIGGNQVTFYTLLAHLAPVGDNKEDAPWLADLLTLPDDSDPVWSAGLDRTKRYYKILPVPDNPPRSREGADAPDGSLLVFDLRDRSLDPKSGTIATDAIVEVETALDGHGWTKVKTTDGSVEGWIFGEGRVEPVDACSLDSARKDKRTALLRGDPVRLDDLDQKIRVRAGEVVGRVGTVGGNKAIHFEIFSSDLIQVDGKSQADLDDSSDDVFMDRAKFEQTFFHLFDQTDQAGQNASQDGSTDNPSLQHFMINSPTRREDDAISEDEIRTFYSENALRERLRSLITHHHSEWSDQIDWSPLDSAPQWAHVPDDVKQAFKDAVQKLQWWSGSFISDLVSSHVTYHYHPIHFLCWVDEQRESDSAGDLHKSVFDLNYGQDPQSQSSSSSSSSSTPAASPAPSSSDTSDASSDSDTDSSAPSAAGAGAGGGDAPADDPPPDDPPPDNPPPDNSQTDNSQTDNSQTDNSNQGTDTPSTITVNITILDRSNQPFSSTMWCEVNDGNGVVASADTSTGSVSFPGIDLSKANNGCITVNVYDEVGDYDPSKWTHGPVRGDGTVVVDKFSKSYTNPTDPLSISMTFDVASNSNQTNNTNQSSNTNTPVQAQLSGISASAVGTGGLSTNALNGMALAPDASPSNSDFITLVCGTKMGLTAVTNPEGASVNWSISPATGASLSSTSGNTTNFTATAAGDFQVTASLPDNSASMCIWLSSVSVTFASGSVNASNSFLTAVPPGEDSGDGHTDVPDGNLGVRCGHFFTNGGSPVVNMSCTVNVAGGPGADLTKIGVGFLQNLTSDNVVAKYGDQGHCSEVPNRLPIRDSQNVNEVLVTGPSMYQSSPAIWSGAAQYTLSFCDAPVWEFAAKHPANNNALSEISGGAGFKTAIGVVSKQVGFNAIVLIAETTWSLQLGGSFSGNTYSPTGASASPPSGTWNSIGPVDPIAQAYDVGTPLAKASAAYTYNYTI
jgi:murein DD-endopeptidase MepM/ murein hydrolase activator NlpD